MIFFKILQQFLVPSFFVFVLFLLGLILILKRKRLGKIFIVIGLALYYIFSISPTADLILKPLENKYQPIKQEDFLKADKIVLLLGEGETDVLRASEVLRLYNQKQLTINNQQLKIIISGASTLDPEENPGLEVKKYLLERGIPEENIILEDKSRNTFESAKNVKELLSEESFFLVTSAYHMPRSMEVFQKMGTNPIPASTDFKIKREYNVLDFFPDAEKLRNTNLALHEYFGILFYRSWYY